MQIVKYPATCFVDRNFGTSGLRKSVHTFKQDTYLEGLLQSIFTTIAIDGQSIVIGGDGRYFNKHALQVTIKMLIAHGVKTIYVGRGGIFSTPAISCFIRKYKLDSGIIFSASHNPAGKEGDFGIKVNGSNGSGISESLANSIYKNTKVVNEYKIIDADDFNLDKIGKTKVLNTEILFIDPVKDYVDFMEKIFDFTMIKKFFDNNNFTMQYEAFNAVTGDYAKEIFHNRLGISLDSLHNTVPKEDFGGNHADPNKFNANHLMLLSAKKESPDIIFASDGDGDRNLIIGKGGFVVSPGDSLAVICEYSDILSFYKNSPKGVARSMPTSSAVDLVALKKGLKVFSVPSGWRFFGSLLDDDRITFCGEESYGTGSLHCGEKDGIWAMIYWLQIIAHTGYSVQQIVCDMWKDLGRAYFARLDYHNISTADAKQMAMQFRSLNNKKYQNSDLIKVSTFNYNDPVTLEYSENKGEVANIGKDIRIIMRESGTSTHAEDNTTLRFYIEKYEKDNIDHQSEIYLKNLIEFVINEICGGINPSIID